MKPITASILVIAAFALGACGRNNISDTKSAAKEPSSAPKPEATARTKEMKTIGGLLKIEGGRDGDMTHVTLNGRPIPGNPGVNDAADIVRKFHADGVDVVLIADSSNGSCCNAWENDNFLIIKADGSASVAKQVPINNKDQGGWDGSFMCGNGDSSPKKVGNVIEVVCNEAGNNSSTTYKWTYSNGVVTESSNRLTDAQVEALAQTVINKGDPASLSKLKSSANTGDVKAQLVLGIMYLQGSGVEKDARAGVSLIKDAAEQGDAKAQALMGSIYAEGAVVQQDEVKALAWFQKAAEQGSSAAENALGVMYYTGSGTVKDNDKAAYWWRKAAAQGNNNAEENLRKINGGGDSRAQQGAFSVVEYADRLANNVNLNMPACANLAQTIRNLGRNTSVPAYVAKAQIDTVFDRVPAACLLH